jgi:hypothetical protein
MNGRQPILCRYGVLLFLPVFCLTMSACARGKSAMESRNGDLARFEESTKELRQLARGDASAQNDSASCTTKAKAFHRTIEKRRVV